MDPLRINNSLAAFAQILRALDANLVAMQAELHAAARSRTLAVVDGPFTGELQEAIKVAAAWLDLARSRSQCAREDIASAHIAISGLASR